MAILRPPSSTALLVLVLASPLQAGDWKHEFAPYVLAAGMDGKTGLRGVTADVDLSFGDVLENLELGFMGAYHASSDTVFVNVDAIYMKLEADKTGPGGLLLGDAELEQSMIEMSVGYHADPHVSVFGGLRYNKIDAEVKVSGPFDETLSASGDESWVDPFVGARLHYPLGARWTFSLRGDVGGFGVGSDFVWQAIALLRWQTTERIGILLSYRYLDMDYEKDSGNRFKYDIATSGPGAGVVLTF